MQRAVFTSDRLMGLAEFPLLLTLMASQHAWHAGTLPEKRQELYVEQVDLRLDWRESPKVMRNARCVFISVWLCSHKSSNGDGVVCADLARRNPIVATRLNGSPTSS